MVVPVSPNVFTPDGEDGFCKYATDREVHIDDWLSTISVIPAGGVHDTALPLLPFSDVIAQISRSSEPFGVTLGAL